jgi:putative ABC transport system ATP-binding protein
MVKFLDVSITFNDNSGQSNVLFSKLNLNFHQGDFTVIVGANGSGKSTLLNLIAGLVLPDSGIITIDDEEVQSLKTYERSKYVARIFQNPFQGSVAELTVIENMRLAYLRNTSKGLKLGIDAAFVSKVKDGIAQLNLGLESKLEQKMGTLSGGQRQALTLVMATLCDAKILLMDEPTAALDPKTAFSLMENANKIINENKLTAIMVTHNLREASAYGNRLLMMNEGKITKDFDGKNTAKPTPAELFELMN